MKTKPSLLLAACVLLLSACGEGELYVGGAWARPAPAGGLAAVYFLLGNGTSQADALLSASTQAARVTEMHRSMSMGDESDAMIMTPIDRVDLAAGQQVAFEPGGYHLMLFDLQQDLVEGDQFTLIMHFEQAGELEVDVKVIR